MKVKSVLGRKGSNSVRSVGFIYRRRRKEKIDERE